MLLYNERAKEELILLNKVLILSTAFYITSVLKKTSFQ